MTNQKEHEKRNERINNSEMDSTTKIVIVVFYYIFGAILIYKFW